MIDDKVLYCRRKSTDDIDTVDEGSTEGVGSLANTEKRVPVLPTVTVPISPSLKRPGPVPAVWTTSAALLFPGLSIEKFPAGPVPIAET